MGFRVSIKTLEVIYVDFLETGGYLDRIVRGAIVRDEYSVALRQRVQYVLLYYVGFVAHYHGRCDSHVLTSSRDLTHTRIRLLFPQPTC